MFFFVSQNAEQKKYKQKEKNNTKEKGGHLCAQVFPVLNWAHPKIKLQNTLPTLKKITSQIFFLTETVKDRCRILEKFTELSFFQLIIIGIYRPNHYFTIKNQNVHDLVASAVYS